MSRFAPFTDDSAGCLEYPASLFWSHMMRALLEALTVCRSLWDKAASAFWFSKVGAEREHHIAARAERDDLVGVEEVAIGLVEKVLDAKRDIYGTEPCACRRIDERVAVGGGGSERWRRRIELDEGFDGAFCSLTVSIVETEDEIGVLCRPKGGPHQLKFGPQFEGWEQWRRGAVVKLSIDIFHHTAQFGPIGHAMASFDIEALQLSVLLADLEDGQARRTSVPTAPNGPLAASSETAPVT